ncbi:MAG TPA: hypothetical protein PKY59_22040 [Pyrinomonadaceae bacterium]|nr:hypothetical protein [Pyrinomonadaceae bacterium]
MIEHRVQSYRLKDFVIEAKSKITVFIGLGLLLSVLILALYFTFYKNNQPKTYRGKVVDKWLTVNETDQGSSISRGILVETENGSRFKVNLTAEDYDRLIVGDIIENQGEGIKR